MPVGIWSRFWRRHAEYSWQAGAISRAVAVGEALPRILEVAARGLLATGRAVRVGVWLADPKAADVLEGVVVESGVPEILGQWKRLELPPEEIRRLLEREEALAADSGAVGAGWVAGPLTGMRAAIWLPIRIVNRSNGKREEVPQGLVLLAYDTARRLTNVEELRSIVAELAVAVELVRIREGLARNASSQTEREELERAVLRESAGTEVLNSVAAQVMRRSGAAFVAVIASQPEPGLVGPQVFGFSGPPECRALLGDGRVVAAIEHAVATRQPRFESLEHLRGRSPITQSFEAAPLHSLLAIPMVAGTQLLGLLVSGFARPQRPPETLALLEPLALPVALILQGRVLQSQVREALAARDALLNSVSDEILLLDAGGNIREASQAAQRRLGFEFRPGREVALGACLAPDAHVALRRWLSRPESLGASGLDSSEASAIENSSLEVQLRSGETIRLRAAPPIGTGRPPASLRVVILERPESPALEAAPALRLQAEFRDLLDSLECGVLVFAADEDNPHGTGRLRFFNARFAQMVGLELHTLGELREFDALLAAIADRFRAPAEFSERWRQAVRGALEEEASWEELELLRPTRKAVERYTRPVLDADGRRLGWLEVYRDITSQRMIQSKLLQTEKMAALGQLVSGIAHELNNPLTSIMGYTQLLMGRRGRADRVTDVKHIFDEAERAGRIVKNLLLFAREGKPERKPVDLNEIVERTLALRSYELRVENIAVELQLAPDLPRTLADAHQLQQVVLNLIVNAEQAILQTRGQGHIRVRTRLIAGNRLGLEVADDGPGVSPEIASRVFDPFFTTKPVGVGTGLGLSIVYGIVHEHGGEVYVESAPGQGATFAVELPVTARRAAVEPEQKVDRQIEVSLSASPSGHRILVVEDEPTVAQLVMDVLGEEGHQVETVLDSQEGLDRLASRDYDLVICDLRMPRIDGRAFHQALVRSGSPAQHRMMFVTGDTLSPRTLEFLERHQLPYLAKPFLVEELKSAVGKVLESIAAGKRPEPRAGASRRASGVASGGSALAVGERREVVRKQ